MPIVLAAPMTTPLQKGETPSFRLHRIRIPAGQLLPLESDQRSLKLQDQLVLTEQVRVMSHQRLLGGPVAKLTKQALFSVEAGVRHVPDLP